MDQQTAQELVWRIGPQTDLSLLKQALDMGIDPNEMEPSTQERPLRRLITGSIRGLDFNTALELLLEHKANPLLELSAYKSAISSNLDTVVQRLTNNCLLNEYCNEKGENILHVLFRQPLTERVLAYANYSLNCIQSFGFLNALSAQDHQGNTPLHRLWHPHAPLLQGVKQGHFMQTPGYRQWEITQHAIDSDPSLLYLKNSQGVALIQRIGQSMGMEGFPIDPVRPICALCKIEYEAFELEQGTHSTALTTPRPRL